MTVIVQNGGGALPLPLRSLVGREQEIAALSAMLQRESVRLVTLTGPHGSGKTRLSLQLAAELHSTFAAGVGYVILTSVNDPALAISAIGHALGVEDRQRQSARQALAEFLKPRQLLLVLDTVDQRLVDASLITNLLADAPELKILVCNRTPLGLDAEHEMKVAPLTLPDTGQRPTLDTLDQYTAIRLFIERAQAAAPGFALQPDQAAAMIDLCAHLDGLPLAIELAAARCQHMTPQAIWDSLAPYLSFQSPGARDLAARQQVMRATLDWTIGLLSPAERQLVCEFAIFGGSAGLAALSAVCQQSAKTLKQRLTKLAKCGLILQDEQQPDLTFWMLDSVREHARSLLDAQGATTATMERFAAYYLELAERAEPELLGSEQRQQLEGLEREAANLHTALQWALAGGQLALGVRFGAALWRFWLMRGFVGQGRFWLEAALAVEHLDRPELRAKALNGLGTLTSVQGDYAQARRAFSASLNIQRALGNRQGIGFLLNNLGLVASEQGEYRQAQSLLKESLALWRELDDGRQQALTLSNLGAMANDLGQGDEARAFLTESLALWRSLDNDWGVAMALTNLGEVLIHAGEQQQAIPLLEEGLAISDTVGDVRLASTARTLLGASLLDQGDRQRACGLLAAGLRQCQEIGDRRGIASALGASAALLADQGQSALAARALGAARTLRAAIGSPLPPAEQERQQQIVAQLMATLDSAGFAAATDQGATAAFDQTVALVWAELSAADAA